MSNQQLADILAQYADEVTPHRPVAAAHPELSASEQQEIESLLGLAGQIEGTLAPVSPAPAFKSQLRQKLVKVARQKRNQDVVLAPAPPSRWLMGAAIGSLMAVIGGIAYVMRPRDEEQSQAAGAKG